MSNINPERDKKLCEAATEIPWNAEFAQGDTILRLRPHSAVQLNSSGSWAVGPFVRNDLQAKRDADFIAQARTLLPLYIAEVERLRAEMAEYASIAYERARLQSQLEAVTALRDWQKRAVAELSFEAGMEDLACRGKQPSMRLKILEQLIEEAKC